MGVEISKAQATQMTRLREGRVVLSPSYKQLVKEHGEGKVLGNVLDYGAGRCEEAAWFEHEHNHIIETYEPFPVDGVRPDYVRAMQIPDGRFQYVVCSYVLNVLPADSRLQVLRNIEKALVKGGTLLLSYRRTLSNENKEWPKYEDGYIKPNAQFQAEITDAKIGWMMANMRHLVANAVVHKGANGFAHITKT